MATLDYNIPDFFESSTKIRLQYLYPELNPFLPKACFVYAGLYTGHSIVHTKIESIISYIDNQYNLGKRIIFFESADEGLNTYATIIVHTIAEQLKEKYNDIECIFIVGSTRSKEAYIELCNRKHLTPRLEILSCCFFELMSKQQWENNGYSKVEFKIGPREKIFTCLNRVLRHHRFQLLDKMLEANLVNDRCYYSFHNSQFDDGGLFVLDEYGPNVFTNITRNRTLVETLRLNFDPARVNPADLRTDDFYLFQNSYFSVIPETGYYNSNNPRNQGISCAIESCVFFSEKTYKPIAMLQPFILVCSAGSLPELKKRGYKTFHPYIDESYDLIEDDDYLRMDAIVQEVKRLSSKTDNEWIEWLQNIKPIVEHNYNVLMSQNSFFVDNEDLIHRLKSI